MTTPILTLTLWAERRSTAIARLEYDKQKQRSLKEKAPRADISYKVLALTVSSHTASMFHKQETEMVVVSTGKWSHCVVDISCSRCGFGYYGSVT